MCRFVKVLTISLIIFGITLNMGIASVPDWQNPAGMQKTMVIHAKAQINFGQYIDNNGSMLAAFKSNECRGVVTIESGPAGKQFQLTVASNQSSEPDFKLKIYDAETDKVHDIRETFNFVADDVIGRTDNPTIYTTVYFPPGPRIRIGGVGGEENTATVEVTAEGVSDLDSIAGTAFTLEYASEITLDSVNSDFFDTFDAQIQAAQTPQPLPDVPQGYDQPLVHNTNKTRFSAARAVATPAAQAAGNVLFTLTFSLRQGAPAGVYPVKLRPTTLYSSDAGYLPQGETLNILIGIDTDRPPTSAGAYPVLISDDADAEGFSVHADHGAVSFGAYIIQATANPAAGGTIVPSGNTEVLRGQDKEFTVTPNACSSIQDILVDGVTLGPQVVGNDPVSYTFTNVTDNHKIEAKFVIGTNTVTVSTDKGEGTITPFGDSGIVTLNCGSDQTFTITPANCHQIGDVVADGVSVMDSIEVDAAGIGSHTFQNVNSDHTIKVTFAANAPSIIKASAETAGVVSDTGGTISPSGDVQVACGSVQTFTIIPNAADHYHTEDVIVDDVSKGPVAVHKFENVTVDHTIKAKFALDVFTIMASAGTGGKITPEGKDIKVPYDGAQTFTITPDPCYKVKNVMVDAASVGAMDSYPFTNITGNHTIEAEFARLTYKIIASAGQGGKIISDDVEVSGAVEVDCGTDKTFNIVPDTDNNYYIADIKVDGQSRGAIPSHTFPSVDADGHTIQAIFERGVTGDIDGDGDVDMTDALLALKILAGMKPAGIRIADVNGDNKISIDEVIFILRKVMD